MIDKWVALLKKMDLTAMPFEGSIGNGYQLIAYNNDSSISLGGFILPYIYGYYLQPMLYVNNYKELSSDFEYLADKMGYSSED